MTKVMSHIIGVRKKADSKKGVSKAADSQKKGSTKQKVWEPLLYRDLHDMGIAVSYCFVLHPMANLFLFSIFIIERFLHLPDEIQ